jgi:hypothetical protein
MILPKTPFIISHPGRLGAESRNSCECGIASKPNGIKAAKSVKQILDLAPLPCGLGYAWNSILLTIIYGAARGGQRFWSFPRGQSLP